MHYLIAAVILAWFIFGDPLKTAANTFWQDRPAPWEEVDAYYYPNREDLTLYQSAFGLSSLHDCRAWVYGVAEANGDSEMRRGDYECAAGKVDSMNGMNIYRITVRYDATGRTV